MTRTDRRLFALAILAFLTYAALFIYRTSFIVGGERYFSLFDDAMVSMRYARNFAHGYGLVWNAGGERVEGYTNPLWVAYMAVIHLLPIAPSKTSLVVQVTAALLLAVNLYFVHRVAIRVAGGSRAAAWGAVALTASYLPLNNWSLQGMEVSVLVLLTTVCTWLALDTLEHARVRPALYALLGIGTLIRPDMAVLFVAFALFMIVMDPDRRRSHARWAIGVLGAALASQSVFRVAYYGDVLPNTYYLKVTGVPFVVRIARGAYVLLQFVVKANPVWFLLAFAAALRRDARVRLLLWIVAVQLAYSVVRGRRCVGVPGAAAIATSVSSCRRSSSCCRQRCRRSPQRSQPCVGTRRCDRGSRQRWSRAPCSASTAFTAPLRGRRCCSCARPFIPGREAKTRATSRRHWRCGA